uniref:Uncharacterized protein n=1 Tax=Fervidicoccus fontis TaxID=683846 RepID=A0A7J3ZK51_9CREN
MRHLYEHVESVRDVVAEKLVPCYELEDVYRAVAYAFIRAALERGSSRFELPKPLDEGRLLKPLKMRIPQALLAAVERELADRVHPIIEQIDALLSEHEPVLVCGEASLERVVEGVKQEVGRVDRVLVYDCMSMIEQVVVSAFLKARDVRTLFLKTLFLNPLGLTRFLTSQLPDGRCATLHGAARYIASKLGAQLCAKNPLVDLSVHESGSLGVDEFVERVDVGGVVAEILEASKVGRTLVFSDHGYDIVLSRRGGYLYVVHGFREGDLESLALLLLSRVSLFMRVG